MKKTFKALMAVLVLLMTAPLAAKDFDWAECWCNYGGGIEKGDVIVNIDGGLWFSDTVYLGYKNSWFIPPVMVDVQVAQPIWKLPFTFGGYAGLRAYGWSDGNNTNSYWGVFFGGEAAYHVMLPPQGLDVYAVTRLGGAIPFVRPDDYWVPDYFHFGEAIGASWYFSDSFGLNLEFGYPLTKFGVSLKFQFKNSIIFS